MWRSAGPSRRSGCRPHGPGMAGLLLAAMVAIFLGWWPQPAAAHTGLVASSPRAGAVVEVLPARVRLVFSRDVEPRFLDVVLTGAEGSVALRGTARGGTVVAPVPVGVARKAVLGGPWRLRYRVVSSDGHPVTGTIRFRVRRPASLPSPSGATETQRADSALAQPPDRPARTEQDASRPWRWVVPLLLAVSVLGVAAYSRGRR